MIPIKTLDCDAISREIKFHSKKQINNLSIVQRVMVEKTVSSKEGTRLITICLEEWVFTFGFVIPGSTNSWQSVIIATQDGKSNERAIVGSQFLIETN